MKIVYFSNSYIPSEKANSIQVMKMCNAFSESGHDVTLFAKSSGNNNNADITSIQEYYGIKNNFNIFHVSASNFRLFGGLEYSYKAVKTLKNSNINPDIIYGRNLYALIACLKLNKPIVYESHTAPVSGKKQLECYLFSKPQFKRLIVINKSLYNYYFKNFDIFKKYPNKILLAADGADIESSYLKETKGIEKPLIGYAGSLYPGKGIETIIKIAKLMPELNFAIAGGSPAQIAQLQKNNKLNNLIFKGFLKPSEIPQFLSQCNILLAPFSNEVYSENFKKINYSDWMSPLKIFEYMASKKPIIASNLPAIKEILEDKKTALLIDYNNISEWKNSIIKILCKPDLAKKLSNSAFELLKNNYSWELRAERVLKNISSKTLSNTVIAKSNNKPIVLHIIGDLNVGGTERNLLKIIPKLNNQFIEHRVLTLFEPGILAEDFIKVGIKVESAFIPRNIFNIISTNAVLKLIKQIRRINPTIIQTWLYHSNNLINLIYPFLKRATINCIRHEDPNAGSIKTKISAYLGAYISKIRDNFTIYCSETSLKKHVSIGYSNKRVLVVPNGFIIQNIDKIEAKTYLKIRLNIPDNYKIAINVGRYCPEKDYPTLFQSIKLVIEKKPDIVFILCGKGLEMNNSQLCSLPEYSSIKNHLILLGNQYNIEKIMAGADFLVSSSSSEAFSNVIAESMSVGTPCIATNVGESQNIVGDTGLIVEPQNPSKLANAIIKMMETADKDLCSLGIKARERISLKYSIEQTLNSYDLVYYILLPHYIRL